MTYVNICNVCIVRERHELAHESKRTQGEKRNSDRFLLPITSVIIIYFVWSKETVILDTGRGSRCHSIYIFPPISNQPELLLHSANASGEKKRGHTAHVLLPAGRRCQTTQYNHRSIARFCDKIRTGVHPLYMHGHRYRSMILCSCIDRWALAALGASALWSPIPFGYQGGRGLACSRVSGACARRRKMQQEATSPLPALSNGYQPLPSLYLGFLAIWAASGFSWAFSTWRNRHYQVLAVAEGRGHRRPRVFIWHDFICLFVVCQLLAGSYEISEISVLKKASDL